jgi:hypothetical protein
MKAWRTYDECGILLETEVLQEGGAFCLLFKFHRVKMYTKPMDTELV